MNLENLEQTIRDYLPDILHMSLATSRDNRPWVCEVHFGYDDELNLYFRSTTNRRHCLEIADNPHVAGNIVTQHGLGEKPRGIYFEGTAQLIDDNAEATKLFKVMERQGLPDAVLQETLKPEGPKFYKITVETFYIFDARESKPAQKYQLKWQP